MVQKASNLSFQTLNLAISFSRDARFDHFAPFDNKCNFTFSLAIITIDRKNGSYYLTNEENNTLNAVTEIYDKVIVLLNVGNVIDMSWVFKYGDKISAIMIVWQGGMESGNAVADLLSGKTNPRGRLCDIIAEKLRELLPFSMTDEKTPPLEIRTIESLQHPTLDAFSPSGSENDDNNHQKVTLDPYYLCQEKLPSHRSPRKTCKSLRSRSFLALNRTCLRLHQRSPCDVHLPTHRVLPCKTQS